MANRVGTFRRVVVAFVMAASSGTLCPVASALADDRVAQPITETVDTLHELIADSDRTGIRTWAEPLSITALNDAVGSLNGSDRDALAAVVLDTDGTSAERDQLLLALRAILGNPALGFYAEIWSYTQISMSGSGFFGSCGQVWLAPDAFDGLAPTDARGVLVHESFHSFDCVNGGPTGALDEGSATWVGQAAFPADTHSGASWAETTYGTKLYYRDLWDPPQPDYPIGSVPAGASAKLIQEYSRLASADPSHLPWNDKARLASCYQTYWSGLDRNVDFDSVWLPAERHATQLMVVDLSCRPVAVPPTPTMTSLPRWSTGTTIPLSWTASPGDAPVTSYDIRYRRAAWDGNLGASVVASKAMSTSTSFHGTKGSTYCFSSRAHDALGSVSPWTPETCTAIALDDRSFARGGGWSAKTGAAYYAGTYLRASKAGAKLVRTHVKAHQIAIVATTCAACGKVYVYWGTTRLKTIDLYSAKTVYRRIISVASFPTLRTGTVTIKVASGGKHVLIDGLVVRHAPAGAATALSVNAVDDDATSGPQVATGQYLSITATGSWCMGGADCGGPSGIRLAHADEPDVAFPGAKMAALIARIGTGPWFMVGSSFNGVASSTGTLRFQFNDRACCYDDNSGSVAVRAIVAP